MWIPFKGSTRNSGSFFKQINLKNQFQMSKFPITMSICKLYRSRKYLKSLKKEFYSSFFGGFKIYIFQNLIEMWLSIQNWTYNQSLKSLWSSYSCKIAKIPKHTIKRGGGQYIIFLISLNWAWEYQIFAYSSYSALRLQKH